MKPRELFAALAAVSLVAGSFVGSAGGAEATRSVSLPYERPQGLVTTGPASGSATLTGGDEGRVRAKSGETAVSVEIVDDAGGTPHGDLHIDQNRDGKIDVHHSFCGATTRPVSVRPRAIVSVGVYAGQCHDDTPALATKGTVEITFHK